MEGKEQRSLMANISVEQFLESGKTNMASVFLSMIETERLNQDAKWGYPQRNTFCEWGCILSEEFGEATKELNDLNFGVGDYGKLITELVHTAAVCLAIAQHCRIAKIMTDRRFHSDVIEGDLDG